MQASFFRRATAQRPLLKEFGARAVSADEADILEMTEAVGMKKPHVKAFLAAWKVTVASLVPPHRLRAAC